MAETMKAWQYLSPGGTIADNIKLTDQAVKPPPSSLKGDDILIKVVAVSINPADYKVPQMGLIARAILGFPKTLGMDGAGEVVAVGPTANDVKTGDHVVARIDPRQARGMLCEYLVVNRDGYAVLGKATKLEHAACLGTAALTAYQCIHPHVKQGDSIFVNGGSGGVGTFAIQIGKLLGCHVAVSCSTSKITLCKGLGADVTIDYKTTDVVQALQSTGRKYNLVVDLMGTSPKNLYSSASMFLANNGLYILGSVDANFEGLSNAANALFRPGFLGGSKHRVQTYLTANSLEDLTQLATWLDQGKITPAIDKIYDFADAVAAFEHLKKGSAAGKIVIRVL